MFLRGVSGVRNDGKQDMESSGRAKMLPGGSPGNKVGSYQNHALENHTHSYTRRSTTWLTTDGNTNVWRSDAIHQSSNANGCEVSNYETRPKNAYVHYIIKY